jgi:HAD superfamily hydrolase (TIGR01509 family)
MPPVTTNQGGSKHPGAAPGFAVIFDLDGLLADTEPIWSEATRRLLARRGCLYDAALKPSLMGRHPLEVMRRLCAHYQLEEDPASLVQERVTILRALYQSGVQPLSGARELVHALFAEEVPMAVASGSPGDIVAWVLRALDLSPPLTVFVGSDAVERGKPAPDLFLLAAQRLGAVPAVCVVLEDSTAGIEAARAAGMRCVAVPSPETPAAGAAKADRVAGTLLDLTPSILRRVVNP